MVCGSFREGIERKLVLDDVDEHHFVKLLHLACGKAINDANYPDTILQLAELSERLQMNAVTVVLEAKLVQELRPETSVEMLVRGEASGLKLLQEACYKLASKDFVAHSNTEAFLQLSEETMERLLEEDELGIGREEDVLEAVIRWMTRNDKDKELRGEGLLRKIRFGTIGDSFLAERMLAVLSGYDKLNELVAEVMVKKKKQHGKRMWDGVERLSEKWLVPRNLKGRMFGCGVLKQPQYTAINCHGRILVSDGELHQVLVFDYDGSVAQRLGSKGDAEGQFKEPAGIAVDQQGNIFVADCGNHRIQMFNADGLFVRCFGSEGSAVGQLSYPSGVAIDLEGRIVVADCDNHRIQIFSADGFVAGAFGFEGAAVGQLCDPSDVAVDCAGRIIVTDAGNERVQVFNRDGCVALCFGSKGHRNGQFDDPKGLAVDREGRLVVADSDNHRIQIFNADGGVAKVVGKEGSEVGEFTCPTGVAVDGAGRILVADTCNGRVQVL